MKKIMHSIILILQINAYIWKKFVDARIVKKEHISGIAVVIIGKLYFIGKERVKNEQGEIEIEFFKLITPKKIIRITGETLEQLQLYPTPFKNIVIPFKLNSYGMILGKYLLAWAQEDRKLKIQ